MLQILKKNKIYFLSIVFIFQIFFIPTSHADQVGIIIGEKVSSNLKKIASTTASILKTKKSKKNKKKLARQERRIKIQQELGHVPGLILEQANKLRRQNKKSKNKIEKIKLRNIKINSKKRKQKLTGQEINFVLLNEEIDEEKDFMHARYQQKYQGLPIWGEHVIVNQKNKKNKLAGRVIVGLEEKITDINPNFSQQVAIEFAKSFHKSKNKITNELYYSQEQVELMIYTDDQDEQVYLVYQVSFLAEDKESLITKPYFLINAKTKDVLKNWEDLKNVSVNGTGPGGNAKTGQYQYGTDYGYLSVNNDNGNCIMENDYVKVVNLNNLWENLDIAYSYTCTSPNYENTYKEINGAYSPLNDAYYFGNIIHDMYDAWYNTTPLSFKLVLKVHYGTNYENAFWSGLEMVFGDGINEFYPLVGLDITSHEIAHGFTQQNSNLTYSGKSGGINEAFSDMAGEAAEFFMKGTNDFKVGAEIFKSTGALRYMYNPPLDGRSIGHVDDYYDGIDMHYSSGIFNKAFYLLATTTASNGGTENWGTKKAFDVFFNANRNYWTPSTDFFSGACGVLRAGQDLNYDISDIENAFSQVGIDSCLSFPEIVVSSSTYNFELPKGNTSTENLIISNTGKQQLDWSIVLDNYYQYTNTNYNWIDIVNSGTALTLGDDDYQEITLPINFSFYNQAKSSVKISSNGYLFFSNDDVYYLNSAIPNTAVPNDFIAPFWDDLNPTQGGTIHYYYDQANSRFIVQYTNIPHYSNANYLMTFQVMLYANGEIIFQYQNMTGGLSSATVGVEDSNGTNGLQVIYNSSYVENQLAILIKPKQDWLNISSLSGSIAASDSQVINLNIDTNDLVSGIYYDNIFVTSNDPAQGQITIPVNLTVTTLRKINIISTTTIDNQDFSIPIKLEDFDNLGKINFDINFSTSSLEFLDYSLSLINQNDTSITASSTANSNGLININWLNTASPLINIDNQILLNLNFKANNYQGNYATSSIQINNDSAVIQDSNLNNITGIDFTNSEIQINPELISEFKLEVCDNDSTCESISSSTNSIIFSPNNDNQKEFIKIDVGFKVVVDYEINILDSENNIKKSWQGNTDGPYKKKWEGVEDGNILADGIYRIQVLADSTVDSRTTNNITKSIILDNIGPVFSSTINNENNIYQAGDNISFNIISNEIASSTTIDFSSIDPSLSYNITNQDNNYTILSSALNSFTMLFGRKNILISMIDLVGNKSTGLLEIILDNEKTKPINIKAIPENQLINLSWEVPTWNLSQIQGYNIYQSSSADFSTVSMPINNALISTTTYSVVGLNNNTKYFFAFTMVDENEYESVLSDLVFTSPYEGAYYQFGEIIKISSSTSASNPSIYENKIVWADSKNSNADIYMYDLDLTATTQITTNLSNQYSPVIYGNKIVWQDDRNGESNFDIYMYDLGLATMTQITTNLSSQYNPDIYGDKIVWRDHRDSSQNIYLYDLNTQAEQKISSGLNNVDNHKIHDNKIIWSGYQSSFGGGGGGHSVSASESLSTYSNTNIYLYDLDSTNPSQVKKIANLNMNYTPSIYNNKIVYEHENKNNKDIYLYDLDLNTNTQITFSNQDQYWVDIYNNIVWKDKRNSKNSKECVYLYDLIIKNEYQIYCGSYIINDPKIYQDKIIWQENGNIYMRKFYTIPDAPVSLNTTLDSNNENTITWTESFDPNGIKGAWYKIGSEPSSSTDGVYITDKTFTVTSTALDQKIYLWLENNYGYSDYNNVASTTLLMECTTSDWTAREWSSCSGSTKTRTVTKNNTCSGDIGKPDTSEACTSSGGGGGGSSSPTKTETKEYPKNITVIINNSAFISPTTTVSLTIQVTDADYINIYNDHANNFSEKSWQPYASSTVWKLSSGQGEKIVYVKFKNKSGEIRGPAYDSIIFGEVLGVKVQEVYTEAENKALNKREQQMQNITKQANILQSGDLESLLAFTKQKRDLNKERETFSKYTTNLITDNSLTNNQTNAITNFILYSTESNNFLGAGECAGVINSFKSAFDKLPQTETDWQDVIKIANGRWPEQKNLTKENKAKEMFKKIYLREANMDNPNDNAGVTIMSYGLRSDKRRLDAEKPAIKTFKHIFKYNPATAIDWDIVRAIAYSGSVR